MADEEVKLSPHSGAWTEKFLREKCELARVLAHVSPPIEHIGSSAVPGLPAKPIVDIAIKVDSVSLIPSLLEPLAELSYSYIGEHGVAGRHFFIKGVPREFHLHIVDGRSDHWERWLTFRDILIRSEKVRQDYLALKKELTRKYHDQREKYTAGKSAFIDALVNRELYGGKGT